MRIAVTGGSGFIGAHVVDRLLDAGHHVRALDVVAGPPDPRADQRRVDVRDLTSLTEALRGCDVVFHLAGMSNVDVAFADPVRTVRLNVEGTANVCEAARQVGVSRVVLASTVWVYAAAAGPVAELDGLAGPAAEPSGLAETAPIVLTAAGHVYTSTKIAAELLLHTYRQTYGLPVTILRYGVPYGPGMRDELVLAQFVQRASAGEPLSVAGDGRQVRNYVYVRDLADAHVLALDRAAENETIALDGAEPISVLAMAETVRDHFPGTTIVHGPSRAGDFRGRAVSGQLAADLLGWRPTTAFRDGVRQYVDWFRANRAAPTAPAAPAQAAVPAADAVPAGTFARLHPAGTGTGLLGAELLGTELLGAGLPEAGLPEAKRAGRRETERREAGRQM